MTIKVYYKKPFIRLTYKGVRSFIENERTYGIGLVEGAAFQIQKDKIKKVVVK